MASNRRAGKETPGWICLVGPTGTGKTAAALSLAEIFPIVVINADSRQVYRDLPVVTAQPSPGEQARCPHRLYGFMGLHEAISAGSFAEMARPELQAARSAGRIPVLVGGAGLYLRALAGGLASIPAIPEEVRQSVQQECAKLGPEALHARLVRLDPTYAARIHPRDRQRVTRALEVCVSTGKAFSWWHEQDGGQSRPDLTVIGLRMNREGLHRRLALRINAMLDMGAAEEVSRAWAACSDKQAPGFSGIGCRELLGFVHGDMSLEQARESWLARTRAYAKRQETWFANVPDVHWLASGDEPGLIETFRKFAS